MKKTLIDVSKKTGYSISTISRVLNGKSEKYRISQSAKEVILQSVKELDYQPDIVAQSLRNNTTYTIGLLVPHIDNPFFANIASVVIREAQRYNYTVMLIDTLEDPVQENKAIDSLLSRKIDGIILVPTGENPSKLEEISTKTPIVLIDRYFEKHNLPYVATDNYVGAYQATKLLLESGHSKILCILLCVGIIRLLEMTRFSSLLFLGKTKTVIMLLAICLINVSCIKKINLYQGDKDDEKEDNSGNNNSPQRKDIIVDTDFFYPFGDESQNYTAEITINTRNTLPEENTIKTVIPALKYNKSWLLMLPQDDCKQAAFSWTWAAINGKPLTSGYYYQLGHLQYDDLPPDIYYLGETLGSTDGAGNEVRFSFTTTL